MCLPSLTHDQVPLRIYISTETTSVPASHFPFLTQAGLDTTIIEILVNFNTKCSEHDEQFDHMRHLYDQISEAMDTLSYQSYDIKHKILNDTSDKKLKQLQEKSDRRI